MPRFHHVLLDNDDSGRIVIERRAADRAEVFYVPSKDRLERSNLESGGADDPRVKLLCIDGSKQSLTIFPNQHIPKYSNSELFPKAKVF